MIKKIICPTDFSDVATNAAGYAAKLLAITYFSRKALNDFFKDQVTKKFIGNVEYPILVLHA